MARTLATLPSDIRITDYISLGVIAKTFPRPKLESILSLTKKKSQRNRNLPAHVTMYYVIAMAFFMQSSYGEVLRWLLEGIRWLLGENVEVPITSKGGISQARTRLGWKAVRRLHDAIVRPIATDKTRGARYKHWQLV